MRRRALPDPAYAPDHAGYAVAVTMLLNLVDQRSGTPCGHAAAQVLLSCYHGSGFHLDPSDIAVLPSPYREAAFTMLIQRVLCGTDPEDVIPDGEARFEAVAGRYMHLHVRRRYAMSGDG
jgi:hypothetical protein